MTFDPKREALAFRLWSYATAREWDITMRELADHLSVSVTAVHGVLTSKKWHGRIRGTSPTERAGNRSVDYRIAMDAALDGGTYADAMQPYQVSQ